jgi:hypothetical protein
LQAEIAIEIDVMKANMGARDQLTLRSRRFTESCSPKMFCAPSQALVAIWHRCCWGCSIALIASDPSRHIRGFCGLFPRRSDSGGTERPGQKITQGGNDRVKRALMLAADAARRIDPDLAEVYCKMMTHRSHHHKQALCAVANRLVSRIFHVLRTGKPYVLRDRDGREISLAEAKAIIIERYTVSESIRATRRVNRVSTAA